MIRILFAAILAALLLLSGCQKVPSVPTEPITQPSASPNSSEPEVTVDIEPGYENLYSIAMPITKEQAYPINESPAYYELSYQTMHLIIPDRDVADKLIIDFLGRIEASRTDADQLMQPIAELYAESEYTNPWCYQIHYDPTRIDQGVLSLFGQIISSTDAMHASSKCVSANYDLVTGDVLTLGSILYHAESKEELTNLVISELERMDSVSLYDDFRDSVRARFSRDESTDEAFYFSTTGLCFYFSPYEIAPYSSGTVVVEIPYNTLPGIISDAYFPTERPHASGDLTICDFTNADLTEYEQFAELVMVPNASKVLFSSDDTVQNIRIRHLEWNEDGTTYTGATVVFAANTLSPKDAILLEADFDSLRPNYSISYTRDGVNNLFYIVKDDYGNISMTSNYLLQN